VTLPFACALELAHTYSLVHDDLPAMDDDDVRRARPTSHKVFGDAVAILVGDALLTEAFGVMARARGVPAARIVTAVDELARAAGELGMVGGQARDLAAEGSKPTLAKVRVIHALKTGGSCASVRIGAIVGGASPATSAHDAAKRSDSFQTRTTSPTRSTTRRPMAAPTRPRRRRSRRARTRRAGLRAARARRGRRAAIAPLVAEARPGADRRPRRRAGGAACRTARAGRRAADACSPSADPRCRARGRAAGEKEGDVLVDEHVMSKPDRVRDDLICVRTAALAWLARRRSPPALRVSCRRRKSCSTSARRPAASPTPAGAVRAA
jgi:hypothetical protein